MSYVKSDTAIAQRSAELGEDDLGPGLYVSEQPIMLDSGHLVAVGLYSDWLPNNQGLCLRAWARWIDDDGQTKLTGLGHHCEVQYSHTVDAAALTDPVAASVMKRELLLLVLGEPADAMHDDPVDEPVLWLSERVRSTCSIRLAIAGIADSGPQAAAELLGI